MRRTLPFLAAWTLVVAASAAADAQNWTDSLVPERSFDFGTVARGSKLKHSFKLINTTSYDIHVADTRAKCGCTGVKVGARDIPPGTQTIIEATLDTTKFVNYKASGLTLVLDRPQYAEIDLNLTCFIRGDVVLNPGVADFGVVPRGASNSLTMNLSYAGGLPNWAITKVHTISDHVKAQVREVGRNGGAAQYQITATIGPTAPAGYFVDEITLLTNDSSSPSIPISVAANVQAALTVFPSNLVLGPMKPGSEVTKDILVRSSKPFKVTEVKAVQGDLARSAVSDAAGAMQRVRVTIKAPTRPGPYNALLEIATDMKDEPPARMSAFATVVP